MGYAHSWIIPKNIAESDERWTAVLNDARAIIDRANVPLSSGANDACDLPPIIEPTTYR